MAPSFLDLCVQFPPNPTTITRAPFYTLLLRFFGQRRGEFNWREREGGDGRMDGRTTWMCVCVCAPRILPGIAEFSPYWSISIGWRRRRWRGGSSLQLRVLDVVLVRRTRTHGWPALLLHTLTLAEKIIKEGNGGNSEMQRCRNATTSRPSTSSCSFQSFHVYLLLLRH
jgi:hypothetical protein